MLNAYVEKSTEPEMVVQFLRILGVNDANPVLEEGNGVTVTRTGEGAYRITWSDAQGTFMGWYVGFGAATPADLKGYTAVRDTYAAPVLDFVVYNSTFTAADLIANQYLDVWVAFRRNSA